MRSGFGVFFHVGVNTFTGEEWSDGSVPASAFDPDDLDAEEWVRTAHDLGAAYIVLTAKHHDGFCLWPTATTRYSVASSPCRGGQADVVREVSEACARYGVGFGLYLSPWDRNASCYGDPAAYDDFYCTQLEELCTGYGPITELWFDGAGSAGRTYDWERIGAIIARHQPQAMVFNMGPATIRWVGNEDGLAADPCLYVTDSADLNNYDEDVITHDEPRFLPPECDVSIRPGWFWKEHEEPKSLDHLLTIYERSIGLGANLLLNIPPDRHGRIDLADAQRCRELRAALDQRFGNPLEIPVEPVGPGTWEIRGLQPQGEQERAQARQEPPLIDYLEIREDISAGQRVCSHRVVGADGTVLATGHTVGVRRLHRLDPPIPLQALAGARVECEGVEPVLEALYVHPRHASGEHGR